MCMHVAWHCSCGYKPTMAALLGAIANIDRLAAFRRDCERGFSLAMSTKSNQCQSEFFLKKDTCRLLSLIRCKLQRFRFCCSHSWMCSAIAANQKDAILLICW